MVTVAFWWSISIAAGLPTRSPAHTTACCRPGIPLRLRISMTPRGAEPGRCPPARGPIDRVKASTFLTGRIASSTVFASTCLGNGT